MPSRGLFPTLAAITLVLATAISTRSLDVSLQHDGIIEQRSPLSKSIAEVHIQRRDESEREDSFSTSTCSHDTFVLFGNIRFHITEDWRISRGLELYVEIGHQVWRQPLQTSFYAFQVPVQRFSNIVGLFCLQPLNDLRCLRSLWRRFFIVQGSGGQQLDVEIETGSSPAKSARLQVDDSAPWWTTASDQSVIITRSPYRQLPSADMDWDFLSLDCHNIFCKLNADDQYRFQLVSAFPTVRTWHMLIYGIIFIWIQYLNSILGRIKLSDSQPPNNVPAAEESANAKQSTAGHKNGTGGYEQSSAWQSTNEGGLWSRDSAGRLTRLLPPAGNCADSCN
ncbi:unnamed protein product [Calypogeia fissa]